MRLFIFAGINIGINVTLSHMFSLEQFIFSLTFFSLFFLFTLAGDLPAGIIIIGLVSILFFCFRSRIDFKLVKTQRKFILFSLLSIVIVSYFSLFSTLSIPFSLNKALYFTFSYFCFLFFYYLDRKWMPLSTLKIGFLSIGVAIFFLSSLFSFYPQLAVHINSFTLLVPILGHTHSGIYFVTMLPIFFFLSARDKNRFALVLTVMFLIGIFLSYGRAYIVESIMLLLLCSFFFKKNFTKKRLSFLIALVVSLITVAVFFNLYSNFYKYCQQSEIKNYVCKSYKTDARISYWKQAIEGFVQRPITGWGGGTFSIISLKFSQNKSLITGYAHNEYLQFFSEYGIAGGVAFLVFTTLILMEIMRDIWGRRKNTSEVEPLVMSILVLLINSLLDFDLNFQSIWLLFIIFIALFLREREHLFKATYVYTKNAVVIYISGLTSFIIIFIWVTLYIASQFFWYKNDFNLSERLFPLIYWQVSDVIGTNKIDKKTTEFLLEIYSSDTNVLTSYSQRVESDYERMNLYEKLIKVDNRNIAYRLVFFKNLVNNKQWILVENQLKDLQLNLDKRLIDEYNYNDLKEISDLGIASANKVLASDPKLSKDVFLISTSGIMTGLPVREKFILLDNPDEYSLELVSEVVDSATVFQLIPYREKLTNWYLNQLKIDISINKYSDVNRKVDKILQLGSWHSGIVWDALPEIFQEEYSDAITRQDLNAASDILSVWETTLESVKTHGSTEINQYWIDRLIKNQMELNSKNTLPLK